VAYGGVDILQDAQTDKDRASKAQSAD